MTAIPLSDPEVPQRPPVHPAEVLPRIRGARFAVLLLALVWPAQLLSAAGVASGVSTAGLIQHFHTTQVVWFSLVYTLVSTLLTPIVARLGDIYGKKRVILVITLIGLVGDILVILAPTYEIVLLGRGMAGFYGPIAALVYAAARDIFPPRQVGLVSSVIASSLGLTVLVSPLLCGALLDTVGFRGPLWVIAIGTLIAFLLALTLPETRRRPAEHGFDMRGTLMLSLATMGLVTAISQGEQWGWDSGRVLGLFGLAAVSLAGFISIEKRHPDPLVDVALFTRRGPATVLGVTGLGLGSIFAASTLVQLLALYPTIPGVSDGLGWSGSKLGAVGAVGQLALFLVGLLVGRMSDMWDPRLPWRLGGATVVFGHLYFAFFHADELQVAFAGLVLGLGCGLAVSAAPLLILGAVEPEEQGMASGISTLLNGLFQAIVSQVIFLVAARSGVVAHGTQFYSDTSYRDAYLTAAVFVATATILSFSIPRIRKANEIESGGRTL